jgi:hypothetical protein
MTEKCTYQGLDRDLDGKYPRQKTVVFNRFYFKQKIKIVRGFTLNETEVYTHIPRIAQGVDETMPVKKP